jgi:Uma2 family endonuclease
MASASTIQPVMIAAVPAAEEALYEVVDGQRVELPPMGSYATWIASNLQGCMWPFTRAHKLGTVVTEMLFILDAERNLRRRPDVAFVSVERWPLNRIVPDGDWEIVPSLAVEVISPNEFFEDVIAKIAEYFRCGVEQVWVVIPRQKQVYVYQSFTLLRILTIADELDGGKLLPGFHLPVAAIFGGEAGNGAPIRQ